MRYIFLSGDSGPHPEPNPLDTLSTLSGLRAAKEFLHNYRGQIPNPLLATEVLCRRSGRRLVFPWRHPD